MKIFIGADHRGFDFKKKIIDILQAQKYDVLDLGTYNSAESYDYPKAAYDVATRVVKTKESRGILVCMSGIGQAIAANKVKGAYAALCHNVESAVLSRQHNNANILVLSAKFINARQLNEIVNKWLTSEFEGGRHLRRFKQIQQIEKGIPLK